MTAHSPARFDASKYPSLDLAYDFVLPSYDYIASRTADISTRIRQLLTVAAAATLGAPVFVKTIFEAGEVTFRSGWFIAAVGCFVIALAVGLFAHTWGTIRVFDLGAIYKNAWLPEPEFRNAACHWAAKDFAANRSLVNRKGWLSDFVAASLFLELLCLLLWIATPFIFV